MRAVKILGLSVAVINVMYSVVYMGIAGTDLYIVTGKSSLNLQLEYALHDDVIMCIVSFSCRRCENYIDNPVGHRIHS